MRLDYAVFFSSLLSHVAAAAVDGPWHSEVTNLGQQQDQHNLFKCKGGGGRGGGYGKGGSGGTPRGSTVPSSNIGGTLRGGSSPPRSFGGGRFYNVGSATPFRAGRASPLGIAPLFLVGAAVAFWPGLWLYGAHLYPYAHQHRFHNANTDRDETIKVVCACAEYAVCGCDENDNSDYYDKLIGNGSYKALNKSIVNVGQFRGSKALLINGTLPNGTTADGPDESAAGSGLRGLVEAAGYWPVVATVVAAIFLA